MTLSSRLQQIRHRIAQACSEHGRDLTSVQLLPVSKTFDAATVAEAYALGLRDFGENYVQEAVDKMALLPADIAWHHIGPLQSNKAKWIANQFSWCQSVDSLSLAERLSRLRGERPPLNICLQLHIGGEASKSGLSAAELLAIVPAVAQLPRLRLRGVMTIPPPSDDLNQQRHWFAEAREVFQRLQQQLPDVDTLSMGMSADLEAAIAEGSTMVRVGSALFGARPPKAIQS